MNQLTPSELADTLFRVGKFFLHEVYNGREVEARCFRRVVKGTHVVVRSNHRSRDIPRTWGERCWITGKQGEKTWERRDLTLLELIEFLDQGGNPWDLRLGNHLTTVTPTPEKNRAGAGRSRLKGEIRKGVNRQSS